MVHSLRFFMSKNHRYLKQHKSNNKKIDVPEQYYV